MCDLILHLLLKFALPYKLVSTFSGLECLVFDVLSC